MTSAQLEVASGVIVALITVIGLYRGIRRDSQVRAAADAAEKKRIHDEAVGEGAKSRDDEVALMRSQRDDARQQRDEAKLETRDARTDARAWEKRYNDLRDRRSTE